MPAQNPSKEAVWEVVVNGSATGNTQLVCAVPFLASDIVRGIVATEVDSERLAERLASNLKALRAAGFLLAGGERVLATIRTPDGSAGLSGPLAVVLKDQKLAGLEFLFKRESNSERFVGRQSGFYVAIRQAALLPLKAVLVVPEAFVPKAIRSSQEPGGRPFWWLIGAGLAGALLLVDVWWLSRMRQQVAESDKKLSDSLTALSDLNLQSALVAGREGMAREQPQRLQEGLASTRKALEAGRGMTAPEELAAVTAESVDNLKRLEQLASVVAVFSANDSAEGNLGRLAEALRRAFGARRVSILSYSEPASKFVPREAEGLDAGAAIDSASRALFGALKQGEGVISSNLLTVPSDEERSLSPLVQGGYLAVPLLDGQRVLGAVVVSDIPAGVSNTDEAALEALQRALSNTVQNIDRCDRLARLNQLRREYSVELAKAVEAPLDRIRTEVQSIYARLGRLTPYYKHHCETILFEAGKLYEMLREVREAETAIDRDAAQPAAASKALPFGSDPASGD
jgi:GAF domain-containing protein